MNFPFYNSVRKDTDDKKSEEGVSSKYLRHFVDVIARYPEAWAVVNNVENAGAELEKQYQQLEHAKFILDLARSSVFPKWLGELLSYGEFDSEAFGRRMQVHMDMRDMQVKPDISPAGFRKYIESVEAAEKMQKEREAFYAQRRQRQS